MAKVKQTHPSMLARAQEYLAYRRALGYVMSSGGLLLPFGQYADRVAPGRPLTTALALQWACSVQTTRAATRANRLSMVRGLARYCAASEPDTQIPPSGLIGPVFQRVRPHIFNCAEIRLLLRRARALSTHRSDLHPKTYHTLIGLLACTGMRPGEALRLNLCDFDSERGELLIRRCKFSPQRVISLHSSTVKALRQYCCLRQALFPAGETIFVGTTGRPLSARRTEKIFARLTRGVKCNGQRRSPRLMDFRHRFATARIAQWSRQSEPVSHHLLLLARYLGHRSFNSTWWYVSSDASALRSSSDAFAHFHKL